MIAFHAEMYGFPPTIVSVAGHPDEDEG